MTKKIIDELSLNQKTISDIAKLLDNKIKCNNQKEILHLSYFDISIEHMCSISVLINHGYTGSSFALIRPFYETIYRSLWVFAFADKKTVNNIIDGKHSFGKTSKLIKELDKFYSKTNFFESYFNNFWHGLSGYTHTDILPISRRWTKDQLVSSYTNKEIIQVLQDLRQMLFIFTFTILKKYNLQDEAKLLIDMKNGQATQ